ncbi:MAG TPA: urease accessory protein UreE [Steroidobacteraceae bacterium]|nr:urease accessory protein UreE [Steroidobacteraceae bacterium]
MLQIAIKLQQLRAADARLVLPFDLRCRSRFRATLDSGEEVGIKLARGQVLRGGEQLLAADGRVVEIVAARETVSVASSEDPLLLARAAYHLGNRHVGLQIGAGWLLYQHDHVLDDLVQGLGLQVSVEQRAFEPEAGAYHGAGGASAHHHHD